MFYSDNSTPSTVKNLLADSKRGEQLKAEATEFKSVSLTPRQLCDLEMLLSRAYYPLTGYMCREDYDSVLESMRLTDGTMWPLPICLEVEEGFAKSLNRGERVAVRDAEGFMLAVLTVGDVWQPDRAREAAAIWGDDAHTEDLSVCQCELEHPWYVGGALEGLAFPQHYDFLDIRLTPEELSASFEQKGLKKVIGVQAGRPLHQADRAMLKEIAAEENASLLLLPLMPPSMYSSIDHFTLVRCFKEFMGTFQGDTVALNLIPWFERKMGPRDALLRAIVNRNYGCTHILVWDSDTRQRKHETLSAEFQTELGWLSEQQDVIGIKPIAERCMALNEDNGAYRSTHEGGFCINDHHAIVDLLVREKTVPDWMSFPGIIKELKKKYKPRSKQGFTLFFTGLSGAGKSTMAKVLYVKLLEMNSRPVTLLDGDYVRSNLSSELNFSKAHRNLNVTRIGFVASEIVKNGGVAVCAPIAPYPESRRIVRGAIEEHGGFIEIHVSTPLEICEQRDRKGIYAKARAGIIKGLTGVDDPYIEPENPELRIDTTKLTPNEAAQVILQLLSEKGFVSL
ncbi:adenylyl-sulfate kinase [Pseudodesulfovibrio sediminis]|uniref:Adenylyl-sulfate kinase n=1 Tax=Pseudodesulfovibrio sediminis TaxID=2810563 RepID=A0ABN6ESM1_9BACT|nr:adenylyl-sulfate kinase [Pseudodesulfovibrio sediminis]BCS88240.1 sulfate adenylyltransferase [Pseudodesulfovibrio sediminis]